MKINCYACQKNISVVEPIGRREECPECGADIHVCLNCLFYDEKSYNECRESQAERVLEKGKANFCDYFKPGYKAVGNGSNEIDEAKKKLENLFKKS